MPRIAGVDIPEKKKIRYALRYVYGIGPKFADDISRDGQDVDPENACIRTRGTATSAYDRIDSSMRAIS